MKNILALTAILFALSIGSTFVLDHNRAKLTDNKQQQPQKVESTNQVESINKEKMQDLIKNRNGKALLVNVWATWCGPCREEFPDLVKLEYNFKDKNLDIVGISVDDKKEVDTKVIPFLKEQKANFRVFINGFAKDDELIDFFDKKWQGEIPVTLVYDSKGSRKAFLIGSQDYNTFKKEVETAMK